MTEVKKIGYGALVRVVDDVPQCPHCQDPMVQVDGGWMCPIGAAALDVLTDAAARLKQADPEPGWMANLDQAVADVNARLAAAGHCYMHNPGENVPAEHLMELPNGNVVPLCTPCCDWWLTESPDAVSGDPEGQPVRVTTIDRPEATR